MKKLLKYILPIVAFAAMPIVACAQDNAGTVLRTMGNTVKALGNYTASFKLTAEGSTAVGEYTVSGDKYFLSMADIEVYSDGRTRYEVNHSDDEVLIDILDPSATDILSNPTRAFDFSDDAFTASYRGLTTVSGKAYHAIDLVPKDRDSSIRNVELLVDRATNLPHSISYAAEGISGYVIVEVLQMASAQNVPANLFSPDMSLFRGYEIIDFR